MRSFCFFRSAVFNPLREIHTTIFFSKIRNVDKKDAQRALRTVCENTSCRAELNDHDINEMVKKGSWIKTASSNGIAGFGDFPEIYSPFVTLEETVEGFLRAKKLFWCDEWK